MASRIPALTFPPCTDMTDIVAPLMPPPALNVSTRKVGGLRFLKIGRLTISWSVSKVYKPL